jgi:cytochrome c-type biogenesis protein CcmH/NrfF
MSIKKLLLGLILLIAGALCLLLPPAHVCLEQQLYCPVCFGQNIFESNHPIAQDIMTTTRTLKEQGLSEKEIKEQLHILYGPKISGLDMLVVRLCFFLILFAIGVKRALF